MSFVEKVREYAKDNLDELRWLHTTNVVKFALELAEKEGADTEIVEIAAWLHDIGTIDPEAKIIDHHIYSAKIAKNLLKELGFEANKTERVERCILEHMGPEGSGFLENLLRQVGKDWDFLPRPSSIEAKVVYDADMIDLGGPFGITKLIYLNGTQKRSFSETLAAAKDTSTLAISDLKTESGKALGQKYAKLSRAFFEEINEEQTP